MSTALKNIYGYNKEDLEELDILFEKYLLVDPDKKYLTRLDEFLFQFSPRLVDEKSEKFNYHEPWINFHRTAIISTIVEIIIDKYLENNDSNSNEYWDETLYSHYLDYPERYDTFINEDNFYKTEQIKIFLDKIVKEINENL